jgi:hypothetical protein
LSMSGLCLCGRYCRSHVLVALVHSSSASLLGAAPASGLSGPARLLGAFLGGKRLGAGFPTQTAQRTHNAPQRFALFFG